MSIMDTPEQRAGSVERRHLRRPGVFIVNFEFISHLSLAFLLLAMNK